VLAVLVRFALSAHGEAEHEEALFARAKELGFQIEEYGSQRVRSQMPLLGIPVEHGFSATEIGTPVRHRGHTHMHVDSDPNMRDAPVTTERRMPVAVREDRDESLLLFRLPEGLRDHGGAPRAHDLLILGVNPRASALVAGPDASAQREANARGWTVEVQGAWLLVYRTEPRPMEALDAFVDEALGIAHRFV
jgi:hypothetical protein